MPRPLQVLEQALNSSVVANAETGQLWAARAVPATGAPIADVWRALEALHALEQPLTWLSDQLLVRAPIRGLAQRCPSSGLTQGLGF